MALHIVQMEEDEFKLLTDLLDASHRLRLKTESGAYKGALHKPDEVPAARALHDDIKAVLDASRLARPSND